MKRNEGWRCWKVFLCCLRAAHVQIGRLRGIQRLIAFAFDMGSSKRVHGE